MASVVRKRRVATVTALGIAGLLLAVLGIVVHDGWPSIRTAWYLYRLRSGRQEVVDDAFLELQAPETDRRLVCAHLLDRRPCLAASDSVFEPRLAAGTVADNVAAIICRCSDTPNFNDFGRDPTRQRPTALARLPSQVPERYDEYIGHWQRWAEAHYLPSTAR